MRKDERLMRCALWAAGLLPVLWLAMAFAQPVQGSGLSGRLEALSAAMEAPFALAWTADCPRVCALFGLLYLAAAVAVEGTRPKLRPGVEHGSARWGDARELNARFAQRGMENVLLTRNVRLGLDGHRHRRNLNVLVIGGSGAGKTRFYAKPNLMQCNTSYVLTDPKGELLRDVGGLLKARGYRITKAEKAFTAEQFLFLEAVLPQSNAVVVAHLQGCLALTRVNICTQLTRLHSAPAGKDIQHRGIFSRRRMHFCDPSANLYIRILLGILTQPIQQFHADGHRLRSDNAHFQSFPFIFCRHRIRFLSQYCKRQRPFSNLLH